MSKSDDSQNKNIVNLLKRMLVKFDSIEEKIDSLVKQTKERSFKSRQFSSPRKEYNKPERYGVRKHAGKKEEDAGEKKFYHGHPFAKKKDFGKSNFKNPRKPFKK